MNHPDPSDVELAASVARGDEAALEALYDRHAASVMGLALRILGESGAAEEVVQETFWRLWQRAGTYSQERGVFAGWLLRICRNLSIDKIRREQARPGFFGGEAAEAALALKPDPGSDVPSLVSSRRDAQVLRNALAGLPPEQRQVLELAYFRGLTRQEIAEHTGAPLGTIHTRARLGLEKLRSALAEEYT